MHAQHALPEGWDLMLYDDDIVLAERRSHGRDHPPWLRVAEIAVMITVTDCFGRTVRLTDERRAHILLHPEMRSLEAELERVLRLPTEVRVSRSDASVQLFYEFYAQTSVADKWLCVVVKCLPDDAFVITAYLTDKLKAGETIWPTK